jgi:protein involved in polysaccharide export with SLBB domain
MFLRFCFLLPALALLSGCGMLGSSSTPPAADSGLPAAAVPTDDVIRPGDKVTLRLSGVPGDEGYIIEMQIPQSGAISVPLLTRSFQAVGRTPADVAAEISQAYRSGQIYTNPNVTVIPEERYVNVGGDVRTPQRVLYTPDLSLLSAINACGGFTEYANRKAVRILRGQQVIQVDAAAASRTAGTDPALFAGDQIYVPRTVF